MKTLLQAIATEEGYYSPGSRPARNKNPGDLIYGAESVQFGAIGSDGHFAIFPDEPTGFNALRRWLSVPARFDAEGNLVGGYLGATLQQVIYRFSPPSDGNNSAAYVATVCALTGLEPTTVVTPALLP